MIIGDGREGTRVVKAIKAPPEFSLLRRRQFCVELEELRRREEKRKSKIPSKRE